MQRKIFKFISLFLCFCLLFQQTGLAQVAGELDLSGYFGSLRSAFSSDKFRPLHLRYLSYDNLNNSFKLLLDKGDAMKGLSPKGTDPNDITKGTVPLEEATKTLLNYFFVGISLPNSSFWVNLRPDSPDNIIDDWLAQTDVGKILLEADLQLKKDTASFTSPQTPEGKKYWTQLYKKAEELLGYENITIPTLTRPWIVPGEIIIRETQDNAYIYKATLKVMLEQDYLKDSTTYKFSDPRLKALNEYSSQLIRELIIPKLTKEVNTSKRYAPLRQVYYSLILAQWFKARFYGKGGLYSYLIDKKNLSNLTSQEPWSKNAYFKQYQTSFKDGEYNLKEPISTPFGQSVRSYMSGGIALMSSSPIPTVGKTSTTEIGTSFVSVSGSPQRDFPIATNKYLLGLATGGKAASPAEVSVKLEESASSPAFAEAEIPNILQGGTVKLTHIIHGTSVEKLEKIIFVSKGNLIPGPSRSVFFYGLNMNHPKSTAIRKSLINRNKMRGGVNLEFSVPKLKELNPHLKIYAAAEVMSDDNVPLAALIKESKAHIIEVLTSRYGSLSSQQKESIANALGYSEWTNLAQDLEISLGEESNQPTSSRISDQSVSSPLSQQPAAASPAEAVSSPLSRRDFLRISAALALLLPSMAEAARRGVDIAGLEKRVLSGDLTAIDDLGKMASRGESRAVFVLHELARDNEKEDITAKAKETMGRINPKTLKDNAEGGYRDSVTALVALALHNPEAKKALHTFNPRVFINNAFEKQDRISIGALRDLVFFGDNAVALNGLVYIATGKNFGPAFQALEDLVYSNKAIALNALKDLVAKGHIEAAWRLGEVAIDNPAAREFLGTLPSLYVDIFVTKARQGNKESIWSGLRIFALFGNSYAEAKLKVLKNENNKMAKAALEDLSIRRESESGSSSLTVSENAASSPMKNGGYENIWQGFIDILNRIPRGIGVSSFPSTGNVYKKLPFMKFSSITTVFYMDRCIGVHPDAKWRYDVKVKDTINGHESDFIGFLIFADDNYRPVAFAINSALFSDNAWPGELKGMYVLMPVDNRIFNVIVKRLEDEIPPGHFKPFLNASNFADTTGNERLFTSHLKERDREKLAALFSSNIYFRHLIEYLVAKAGINVGFGNLLFLKESQFGGEQDFVDHSHGRDLIVRLNTLTAFNPTGDKLVNDEVLVHEIIHVLFDLWAKSYNDVVTGRAHSEVDLEHKANIEALQYLAGRKKLLETGKRSASTEDVNKPSYYLLNETLAYLFGSVYYWLNNPTAIQPSPFNQLARNDITYEDIQFLHKLGLLPDESLRLAKDIFSQGEHPETAPSQVLEGAAAASPVQNQQSRRQFMKTLVGAGAVAVSGIAEAKSNAQGKPSKEELAKIRRDNERKWQEIREFIIKELPEEAQEAYKKGNREEQNKRVVAILEKLAKEGRFRSQEGKFNKVHIIPIEGLFEKYSLKIADPFYSPPGLINKRNSFFFVDKNFLEDREVAQRINRMLNPPHQWILYVGLGGIGGFIIFVLSTLIWQGWEQKIPKTPTQISFYRVATALRKAGVEEQYIQTILSALNRVDTDNPKKNADNFLKTNATQSFASLINTLKNTGVDSRYIRVIIAVLAKAPNPKEAADNFMNNNIVASVAPLIQAFMASRWHGYWKDFEGFEGIVIRLIKHPHCKEIASLFTALVNTLSKDPTASTGDVSDILIFLLEIEPPNSAKETTELVVAVMNTLDALEERFVRDIIDRIISSLKQLKSSYTPQVIVTSLLSALNCLQKAGLDKAEIRKIFGSVLSAGNPKEQADKLAQAAQDLANLKDKLMAGYLSADRISAILTSIAKTANPQETIKLLLSINELLMEVKASRGVVLSGDMVFAILYRVFEAPELKKTEDYIVDALLLSTRGLSESILLGWALYKLVEKDPQLKVKLAPFIIMNAWRETGVSGEHPFLYINGASTDTAIYKFISSFTDSELGQLEKENHPALIQIIRAVRNNPDNFNRPNITTAKWIKFKEAFKARYLRYRGDDAGYKKEMEFNNSIYDYRLDRNTQEISAFDYVEGRYVNLAEAVETICKEIGVEPPFVRDMRNEIEENPLYYEIIQALISLNVALLCDETQNTKHPFALELLERILTGHHHFNNTLLVLKNFLNFTEDIQNKIREIAPRLIFEDFLGRQDIQWEDVQSLSLVLGQPAELVQKTIALADILNIALGKNIYHDTHYPTYIMLAGHPEIESFIKETTPLLQAGVINKIEFLQRVIKCLGNILSEKGLAGDTKYSVELIAKIIFDNLTEYPEKVLPEEILRAIHSSVNITERFFYYLEQNPQKFITNLEAILAVFTPDIGAYPVTIKEIFSSLGNPAFLIKYILSGFLNDIFDSPETDTHSFITKILSKKLENIDFAGVFLQWLSAKNFKFNQEQFKILIDNFKNYSVQVAISSHIANAIATCFLNYSSELSLPLELSEALESALSGRMDINNPMHLLANYIHLRRSLRQSPISREIAYQDFYEIIQRAQKATPTGLEVEDLPEEHKLNVRALTYEAFLVREKILELQQHAKVLGRGLIVIANMSYGAVAVAPITEERNGDTYIVGTDIPVWYTKVGSSEAHNNEFVLPSNLFNQEQIKPLAEKNPFVVVVDGSTSVADPQRTSPHIPDGFKGYRNFFMALNQGLYGAVNPVDFYEDDEFAKGLIDNPSAKELIQIIQGVSIKPRAPNNAYKFRFWYERKAGPDSNKDEFLYLRVNKQKDIPAPKVDLSKIDSPTCIFIQSAIHPQDVDPLIQKDFIGGPHAPAYFDDKGHFKEFYLDYEEGYGVVLSKRYVYLARNIFREFMRSQGRALAMRTATAGKVRQVETVVLDLDGTLAKTDAILNNGTAGIINNLLREGKRVVIITEDIEANVDRRLNRINKKPNLVIFSDSGTKGYSFDPAGEKYYFDDYNQKSAIDVTTREKILGIISANFAQDVWAVDKRPERTSDYRIDLNNVSDRTHFVNKLQKLLSEAGIKAKVYKVGGASVKVVLQHKEHALQFFLQESPVDRDKILIIADSAHSYGVDRGLLTALSETISINVGSFSPSISQQNPNIVQYDRGGIDTTLKLLSNVEILGGLPENLIVPSAKGQPYDREETKENELVLSTSSPLEQPPAAAASPAFAETEIPNHLMGGVAKVTHLLHSTSVEKLEKIIFTSQGYLIPGPSGAVFFYGFNMNLPKMEGIRQAVIKRNQVRGGVNLEFSAARLKELAPNIRIYANGEVMSDDPVPLAALTRESKIHVIRTLESKYGTFNDQQKKSISEVLGYSNWQDLTQDLELIIIERPSPVDSSTASSMAKGQSVSSPLEKPAAASPAAIPDSLRTAAGNVAKDFDPQKPSQCVDATRWLVTELNRQRIRNQERQINIPFDASKEPKIGDATTSHTILEVSLNGQAWVIDTQLLQLTLQERNKLQLPPDFVLQYVYPAQDYYTKVLAFSDSICAGRITNAIIETAAPALSEPLGASRRAASRPSESEGPVDSFVVDTRGLLKLYPTLVVGSGRYEVFPFDEVYGKLLGRLLDELRKLPFNNGGTVILMWPTSPARVKAHIQNLISHIERNLKQVNKEKVWNKGILPRIRSSLFGLPSLRNVNRLEVFENKILDTETEGVCDKVVLNNPGDNTGASLILERVMIKQNPSRSTTAGRMELYLDSGILKINLPEDPADIYGVPLVSTATDNLKNQPGSGARPSSGQLFWDFIHRDATPGELQGLVKEARSLIAEEGGAIDLIKLNSLIQEIESEGDRVAPVIRGEFKEYLELLKQLREEANTEIDGYLPLDKFKEVCDILRWFPNSVARQMERPIVVSLKDLLIDAQGQELATALWRKVIHGLYISNKKDGETVRPVLSVDDWLRIARAAGFYGVFIGDKLVRITDTSFLSPENFWSPDSVWVREEDGKLVAYRMTRPPSEEKEGVTLKVASQEERWKVAPWETVDRAAVAYLRDSQAAVKQEGSLGNVAKVLRDVLFRVKKSGRWYVYGFSYREREKAALPEVVSATSLASGASSPLSQQQVFTAPDLGRTAAWAAALLAQPPVSAAGNELEEIDLSKCHRLAGGGEGDVFYNDKGNYVYRRFKSNLGVREEHLVAIAELINNLNTKLAEAGYTGPIRVVELSLVRIKGEGLGLKIPRIIGATLEDIIAKMNPHNSEIGDEEVKEANRIQGEVRRFLDAVCKLEPYNKVADKPFDATGVSEKLHLYNFMVDLDNLDDDYLRGPRIRQDLYGKRYEIVSIDPIIMKRLIEWMAAQKAISRTFLAQQTNKPVFSPLQQPVAAAASPAESQPASSQHLDNFNLLLRLVEGPPFGIKREEILRGKILNIGLETDWRGRLTHFNIVTELQAQGADVIGLDPHPQLAQQFQGRGNFVQGLAQDIPFGDSIFDTVISINLFSYEFFDLIYTRPDKMRKDGFTSREEFCRQVAEEIKRVLKDNGKFFVTIEGVGANYTEFLSAFSNAGFDVNELGNNLGAYLMINHKVAASSPLSQQPQPSAAASPVEENGKEEPAQNKDDLVGNQIGRNQRDEGRYRIVSPQEKDSLGTESWKKYLDRKQLLEAWLPMVESPYMAYVKTRTMDSVESLRGIIKPRYSLGEKNSEEGIDNLIKSDILDTHTAIILDSGGPHSIAMAIRLMKHGYQPVVMIDAVPHPRGSNRSEQELATLLYFAAEAKKLKEEQKFMPNSPPVFILDRHRNGQPIGPFDIFNYDNSYYYIISDFPTAEDFISRGITKAIYLSEVDLNGQIRDLFQSTDMLVSDLKFVVKDWELKRIKILYTGVAPLKPEDKQSRGDMSSSPLIKPPSSTENRQEQVGGGLGGIDASQNPLSIDSQEGKRGGIDFRGLPITTQPVLSTPAMNAPAFRPLSNINLDESWQQIENMLKAGIIPSSSRLKEYLGACCAKDNIDGEIDKVLSCIADILRLEEERCLPTEAALKDILVLLESDKPAKDIPLALSNIMVLPKEVAVTP